MSLLATYGFDCAGTPGSPGLGLDQQWDFMTGSWGNGAGSLIDGYPGPPGAGPPGSALFKWNGDNVATRLLPEIQTSLALGLAFGQRTGIGSGTAPTQNQFLQMANASGVVLSVETELDGSIAVLLGGDGNTGSGTLLGQTAPGLIVVSTWLGYLELVATGLGSLTTNWALYLTNSLGIETLLISGTTNTQPLGACDRFNLNNLGVGGAFFNGVTFDHLYCAQTRQGPSYISTMLPNADVSGVWSAQPGPTRFGMVNDDAGDPNGYPDGDYTYITPPGVNALQWFTLQNSPCYGLILGLTLNICFHCTSGLGTCEAEILQQSVAYDMGTLSVNGPYHTRQAPADVSFASGVNFTDAEINGSYWGVSTTSLDCRVTQMFVEKLVSLRDVPFNCGAGDYSF